MVYRTGQLVALTNVQLTAFLHPEHGGNVSPLLSAISLRQLQLPL